MYLVSLQKPLRHRSAGYAAAMKIQAASISATRGVPYTTSNFGKAIDFRVFDLAIDSPLTQIYKSCKIFWSILSLAAWYTQGFVSGIYSSRAAMIHLVYG
jgi:hypothetical protein